MAIPETAREDIWVRERESDAALKRYDGLDKYATLAEQNGTTLQSLVERLFAYDTLCRQDPLAAIDTAVASYNWSAQAIAYAFGVRHGVIAEQPVASPGPTAADVAASAVAEFAADPAHEFYDLVKTEMQSLINSGQCGTLLDAYTTACNLNSRVSEIRMSRLRPPVNPYMPARQAAVQQSRAAAKGIGGAPSTAPRPERVPVSHGNAFDDVAAAVAAQKNSG